MGINYVFIFPISVPSLPNSSTIYRLQTSSHCKHFIATIGEKEGENVEIETVERDSSCGEYGEVLCLPSSNVKEENNMVSI